MEKIFFYFNSEIILISTNKMIKWYWVTFLDQQCPKFEVLSSDHSLQWSSSQIPLQLYVDNRP